MKNNLVLTGHKELLDEHSTNILLGKWCTTNLDLGNINYKVNFFHWDNVKKQEKDYLYLQEYYQKILKALSEFLNQHHKVKYSRRYWNIIIGPFLSHILPIIWDHWENIRVIYEKEKISRVKIFNQDFKNYQFKDMTHFVTNMFNQNWRHFIYKEILKFKNTSIEEIKFTNQDFNFKQPKNSSSVFLEIAKIFDTFLCFIFRKQNIIMHQTYFGVFCNLKFNLKLNKLPLLGAIFFQQIRDLSEFNRKNLKLKKSSSNEFENFFENIVLKILPKSYLENHLNLKNLAKKIIYNPSIIFTASAHVHNDLFKVWAAEKSETGKKIIISDHGFYLDNNINFNSENYTADCFIKWGFTDSSKNPQMPPNIFLGKKIEFRKKFSIKRKNILLIVNNEPIYPYRVQSMPIAGQIMDCYESWKKIYYKLDEEKKNKFIFRLPPGQKYENDWNIKEKIYKEFGDEKIDKNKKLYNSFKYSKIIINSIPQTTFLETMHYEIPNLLFYDKSLININREIKDLINEMKIKKIMFNETNALVTHLNSIWENPDEWWNSKEIVDFRQNFKRLCLKDTANNFKQWETFFLDEINNNLRN